MTLRPRGIVILTTKNPHPNSTGQTSNEFGSRENPLDRFAEEVVPIEKTDEFDENTYCGPDGSKLGMLNR